jgi:hypothetical protein
MSKEIIRENAISISDLNEGLIKYKKAISKTKKRNGLIHFFNFT